MTFQRSCGRECGRERARVGGRSGVERRSASSLQTNLCTSAEGTHAARVAQMQSRGTEPLERLSLLLWLAGPANGLSRLVRFRDPPRMAHLTPMHVEASKTQICRNARPLLFGCGSFTRLWLPARASASRFSGCSACYGKRYSKASPTCLRARPMSSQSEGTPPRALPSQHLSVYGRDNGSTSHSNRGDRPVSEPAHEQGTLPI